MPVNPSAELVRVINAGEIQLPRGADVRTAILGTSWRGVAKEIPALFEEHTPDFALHFGVASSVQGFRIERKAHNQTCAKRDVHGKLPETECISTQGPAQLECRVDTARLAAALKKEKLLAFTSSDAGEYICNMLFYISLSNSYTSIYLKDALFVHIPPAGCFLQKIDLFTGVQIILRSCMNDPMLCSGTIRTA